MSRNVDPNVKRHNPRLPRGNQEAAGNNDRLVSGLRHFRAIPISGSNPDTHWASSGIAVRRLRMGGEKSDPPLICGLIMLEIPVQDILEGVGRALPSIF